MLMASFCLLFCAITGILLGVFLVEMIVDKKFPPFSLLLLFLVCIFGYNAINESFEAGSKEGFYKGKGIFLEIDAFKAGDSFEIIGEPKQHENSFFCYVKINNNPTPVAVKLDKNPPKKGKIIVVIEDDKNGERKIILSPDSSLPFENGPIPYSTGPSVKITPQTFENPNGNANIAPSLTDKDPPPLPL